MTDDIPWAWPATHRVIWSLRYLHGEDFHLCFVVDGECFADSSVDVQILWPKTGAKSGCGTCGEPISGGDIESMHYVSLQTQIPYSPFPLHDPRTSFAN